jgi:hypothetical protein
LKRRDARRELVQLAAMKPRRTNVHRDPRATRVHHATRALEEIRARDNLIVRNCVKNRDAFDH